MSGDAAGLETVVFRQDGLIARFTLREAEEYVEIEMDGKASVESVNAMLRASFDLPRWTPRFSRLMVSSPGFDGNLGTDELGRLRAVMVEAHEEYYGGLRSRSANLMINPGHKPRMKVWEYVNSGDSRLDLRFFAARESAIAWLTEPAWRARTD